MRRQGPITLRHLAIAVLVVVVINAQLTWWVIFIIGQSRTLLDLQRRLLVDACRFEAERVSTAVEQAEVAVDTVTGRSDRGSSGVWSPDSGPDGRPRSTLPPPFERWAVDRELVGEPGWHTDSDSGPRFEFPCPYHGGTCGLVASPEWVDSVLAIRGDIDVLDATDLGGPRPAVALPPPFDRWALSPHDDTWRELLAEHRRRIAMMVSEGAFFAVLLVVLVGLLWRTVRREVELERQHRNFLSAITHELKSPLAAIRLSLETVARGRADAAASRRFVGNALTDTDRLESLVTKVLEATRYGAGATAIRLVPQSVGEVVEQAVTAFEPRAVAAGAMLDARITPAVWAAVDPEAFTIAVSNLLENALKYGGRPAEIAVDLGAADGRVVLEVRDNGGGIPEHEVPFIFDRFYRAGDEMTRTSQGTGLGLYLVQRIVKAHRGGVSVAATGGGGTTFRITLPAIEVGEDRE